MSNQAAQLGAMNDEGTDRQLLAALALDLDSSFDRLVLAYQDRLYGFALRLSGSPRDGEEIAQDAFVRAYRALTTYPRERIEALLLRPWLFQIALNVARNRARGRRLTLVPLDGVAEPAADERGRPDATAERRERDDELADLVAGLPERYRAAVVLRHVQGLGYEEVATILGQPVGTVKANVHRGLRLLRAALAEQDDSAKPARPPDKAKHGRRQSEGKAQPPLPPGEGWGEGHTAGKPLPFVTRRRGTGIARSEVKR